MTELDPSYSTLQSLLLDHQPKIDFFIGRFSRPVNGSGSSKVGFIFVVFRINPNLSMSKCQFISHKILFSNPWQISTTAFPTNHLHQGETSFNVFQIFTSWFCPAVASLLLRRAVSVGAASNKEVGASSSKEGQRFVTPMGNFCKKFKTEVCNNNHPWNICKSSKNDVSSFGGEPCYRKEKKGFANLRPEKPIPTASTDNTAPL